jgi:hypothetical protein
MRVVCETSDGLEAIQKAVVLLPDLILLDIDLRAWTESKSPGKFGDCPRIYSQFLAQESSADMLQVALSLERDATLRKMKNKAAAELVAAMEQFPGEPLRATSRQLHNWQLHLVVWDATSQRSVTSPSIVLQRKGFICQRVFRNRPQFGPRNGKVRAATIQAHQELGK